MTPEADQQDRGAGTDGDLLAGRFLLHLEEIGAQRASFDRVGERLTRDGFAAAWRREGSDAQADDKGSLERAYEQIVNDLLGAFDHVERAAAEAGKVPELRLLEGSPGPWWSAADALGFDVTAANRTIAPGRWRRLAVFGFMPHTDVRQMIDWCDTRHLLQHAYAARTSERGLRAWDIMHAMRSELTGTIDRLVAFRNWAVSES